jgi:Tfp pilus assembly protein PilN
MKLFTQIELDAAIREAIAQKIAARIDRTVEHCGIRYHGQPLDEVHGRAGQDDAASAWHVRMRGSRC